MFATPEWVDVGQGWQGREGSIQLTGWSRARRLVIVRRALQGEVLLTDEQQLSLAFVEKDVPVKSYEYAVLVTDLDYELRAIAQLYRRDRGDAENAFDELKNQWGWSGFTTHDLKRCRFTAMTVALAYNWWSLFVRLAHPKARLEAITSRPLLLSGIGRLSSHAGQAHLSITPMHAQAKNARAAHHRQRATQGMEKHCGAVASDFGLAARMRVHRDSRHRIQLACATKSTAIDALHIEPTAVFRFI